HINFFFWIQLSSLCLNLSKRTLRLHHFYHRCCRFIYFKKITIFFIFDKILVLIVMNFDMSKSRRSDHHHSPLNEKDATAGTFLKKYKLITISAPTTPPASSFNFFKLTDLHAWTPPLFQPSFADNTLLV